MNSINRACVFLSIFELLFGCRYGATSVPTSVPMGVSAEYDFCVQNVLCDSPLRVHCLGWKLVGRMVMTFDIL